MRDGRMRSVRSQRQGEGNVMTTLSCRVFRCSQRCWLERPSAQCLLPRFLGTEAVGTDDNTDVAGQTSTPCILFAS